MKHESYSLK